MKLLRLLFLLSPVVAGCLTNPPITQEYMTVSPRSVVFAKGDSGSTISITHSCTCPFTWTSKITPSSASAWLQFPPDTTGDHSNIQISVLPSHMSADTNRATITITSNSYGMDSIEVVAYGPRS
ncbi:MAG: hypothetical protein Q8922_06425 [Bacteroidota bacterium]|nr:hypothetical protein [Bacteroidota bacterium]MDP4233794.1 hypothetical protein [Bacteroidota bacterium]MDP4242433.1 hypothetical protein [Bacteroidota bacterium]MDP4287555.1 hypothetical protein [Bacteroidota bacterium]